MTICGGTSRLSALLRQASSSHNQSSLVLVSDCHSLRSGQADDDDNDGDDNDDNENKKNNLTKKANSR